MRYFQFAVAALVIGLASTTEAQEDRGPFSGGGLNLLLEPDVRVELKLSDAQFEKINEMKRLKFSTSPKELEAKLDKELKKVLDEKQQERIWQLILQAEGGRAIEWPNVADKLKLDGAQLDQIKKIREDNAVKRTSLLGLSPEERKKVTDELSKSREKIKAELLTVLSAEQMEIFQKMQGAKFTYPMPDGK